MNIPAGQLNPAIEKFLHRPYGTPGLLLAIGVPHAEARG
jgi:hypothetical protein